MRILIVNNYAHVTGGADLHCLEITEGLRRRGHEVQWLATEAPENVESSGRFVPLAVSRSTRDEISPLGKLDAARRSLWNPAAARAAEELIDEFRPDLVHVHKAYVQLSVAPVVVASRRRLPLVQTAHDYEFVSAGPFDSTGRRWDHDESRFAYRAVNSLTFPLRRRVHRPRITRWITVSQVVADIYRSVGGIDCEVIPNFTAPSSGPPIPRADRSGVAFLGRLTPEKGVEHLLAAARNLPDIRFRIAGDGPLKGLVETAAGSLGNVEYVGFVNKEEGGRLIGSALACLMPSIWEDPGPLSCLEAMAEGTPVICYPKGGLTDYVSGAGAGIVCDRIGPEALTEAITRITSDPQAWERYSIGGRAAIDGRHSRSACLDSLEAVYRSAVDATRTGRQ